MGASTTLLTDANSIITTGFTATSLKNAASVPPISNLAATVPTEGGVPVDPVGLSGLYKTKIQEAKKILQDMQAFIDASDPLATTVANDILTLS